MTARQIETFLTLAETKSFTETASRLFLTQPAVSQQIRTLENDMKCTLFIRSKTGLTLTPAGMILYQEAGSLVSHINGLYSKLRQSSSGKRVVRTLCYLPPIRILPQMIERFSKAHPEVLLTASKADVLCANSQMLFEQNDISVAFGEPQKDYGKLRFIPLFACGIVCIVHPEHELAQKERITASDLHGQTIYTINEHPYNTMLNRINYFFQSSPNYCLFPTLYGIYDANVMAASGQCICIVPDIGTIEGSSCVAIPVELPIQFHIGLYVSKNAPQDVLDFCEIACVLIKENPKNVVIY